MADPVLPTSTNNVTTRKLAATIQGVWEKIDTKKADKVSQATSGNYASLDGNGNLVDSGHKHTDYASSTQGGKADTAVQSVKMGSSSGTELKSGTNVVIPTAVATGTSGATSGVMTSDDKKKLNEIAAGAEVNQNAFSNVVVGSTTIAADSKTDSLTLAQGTHITLTPSSADDKVTIATDLSSKSATSGGAEESLVTTGEKYTWNSKQDTVVWHDTYNASSNKGATKKTVDDAIAALDVSSITSTLGVSKTITELSETDGKIAATASPIQIAESQVTNLTNDLASKAPLDSPALTGTPTAPTATAGTNTTQIATTAFVVTEIEDRIGSSDALVYKGTITLGTTAPGAFTGAADAGWMYKVVANGTTKHGYVDGVAVEVGDMLICNTDGTAAATSSNYQTIVAKWDFIQTNLDGVVTGPNSATAASVAGFSDTTGKVIKQLSATEIKTAAGLDKVKNQAITVTSTSVSDGTNTFNKYEHPTTTAVSAAAVKVGNDATGHVVLGAALTKSDVGLGSVVNTGDSATPVSGGTTKFTTGGAYTELNKKVDKVDGKGLSTNDYTTAEKTKLAGIAEGAEVNQNAFSNVKVGSTTVAADTKTDTVEFVGSGHVTITGDATNDKVTFATDLESKSAASGGTDVSLVTTGEKYTWNSKAGGTHAHGNITNDGKVGSTADYSLVTTTGGAVTAVSMAVSSPTASGNTLSFIDTVSQSSNGKISATKKSVTVDSTYSSTGTNPVNGKAIAAAIGDLDATVTSSDGTNVQVKVTEADGKVTAVNITTDNTENKNNKVTSWSATTSDTKYPSEKLVKASLDGKAASSHAHGNITNDGKITSDTAIANGTKLATVGTDNKVARSPITFDGSTTTTALTPKGTFESFAKQADIDEAIEDIPSISLVGDNHITVTSDDTTGTVTVATDIVSQTPYTAKGSATKVPQITTNSLGQVTGITEVAISGVTPASHTHGNIANDGTLTDTAAAAAGNDYVVIRDAANAKIQTSTIKGTDVADAVSKKHLHSTLTLSTTAQAYDGSHTLALPATDPYTSARTPASHTHGNIQNGGTLQTTDVAIASGDKLVITDSSDSNKVARASISFDGSTATKALTQKGTWETFNNYVHPTTSGNKHIPSGGAAGNILGWSADGTATWIANTSTSRGQGYSATATNSSGTFAVTLSGYELVDGGIVSIKFSAAVPANAKLNINSKGAKSIYYRGSAITADIIQSGDTATFMYNSSGDVYHLIAVDRSAGEMTDQEVTDLLDSLT